MDLLVADLNRKIDENALQKLFEVIGPVSRVKLIRNAKTNESKGFGFVSMVNEEDAKRAIEEFNEREIAGMQIAVKASTNVPAKPKEEPKQKKLRKRTRKVIKQANPVFSSGKGKL